ncbi:MAG: acyltransferase family protein, partial [Candidatus Sulfotelmatobacter sp.]
SVLGLSAIAYLPLEMIFNGFRWSAWGPFTFQTSRGLHYLAYFLLGAGVGAYGLDRGLLAAGGKLARRWWLWSLAALVAFAISAGVAISAMTAHLGSRGWEIGADLGFVLACAAISFAFLAVFVRFARTRRKAFDSLTANAYGIYLIHYAFVSWLQYAVLKSQMSAIAKGSFVFLSAVLLSWGATAALRRIPAVARVI